MKTTHACATCGTSVERQPSGVVGRVFCSRRCSAVALRGQPSKRRAMNGAEHAQWKGGRIEHGGYWFVFRPEHPMANKRGYVAEHRLVMAELLGRPLLSTEHVHHRNLNKQDNRPTNLALLSPPDHARLHQEYARVLFPWSRDAACCRACGTTARRHFGHGLCARCYQREHMRGKRQAGYIAPARRKPHV